MNDAKSYTTLLGKNYLSFLMSFGLLEKTKEVVILDDNNISFPISGPLYELEKNILHTWGRDLNYRPLKEIKSYLKLAPISFIIEGMQVQLGRSPWQNLREMLRKFPHIFADETPSTFFYQEEGHFNESYFVFTARLGEILFRFKNAPNLNLQTFIENCPFEIKSLFEKFQEGISQDRLFRFLCQAFFQRKISRNASEFELFHVFLCLLSPHYEVDKKSFENDLEGTFKESGGQMNLGVVQNMEFKGKKLWKINFNEQEPLVARDVYLSPGLFPRYQFKVATKRSMYTCVNLRWKFERLPVDYREIKKIVLTANHRMGAFGPYSEIRLLGNTLWAQVLVPYEVGAKVEFYKKSITDLLREDLGNIWGSWWEEPVEENLHMGDSLWPVVDRKSFSLGKVEFRLPKKISVKGVSESKKLFGLKNLHYLGSFGGEALGLLSTLMEIKDLRPYK
ncbi:MAG: hypothetical protein DRQ88_08175 [Epsilonproteobacteria bacterium]|nr:MAG: hypothetical protein DRQ89_09195 [Campylobacterota bacterium]RLA66025.1 MAG: hypothetical protein DRQ88_08175 [Campylobacterota bacterium]